MKTVEEILQEIHEMNNCVESRELRSYVNPNGKPVGFHRPKDSEKLAKFAQFLFDPDFPIVVKRSKIWSEEIKVVVLEWLIGVWEKAGR